MKYEVGTRVMLRLPHASQRPGRLQPERASPRGYTIWDAAMHPNLLLQAALPRQVGTHRPGTGSFFGPSRAEKWDCPLTPEGDSPIFAASCRENWDSPRERSCRLRHSRVAAPARAFVGFVGWDKRSAGPPAGMCADFGGPALRLSHPTLPEWGVSILWFLLGWVTSKDRSRSGLDLLAGGWPLDYNASRDCRCAGRLDVMWLRRCAVPRIVTRECSTQSRRASA